mgnify:CR=1 FL=1
MFGFVELSCKVVGKCVAISLTVLALIVFAGPGLSRAVFAAELMSVDEMEKHFERAREHLASPSPELTRDSHLFESSLCAFSLSQPLS